MIQNIYIIDAAGICLYSYDFQRNIFINEQLLSGFLSAITMFAQEAFQTGLQAIQIRNGQKMIFYLEQVHKLMFCAIADDLDNNRLLENVLKEIAQKFVGKMSKILTSDEHSRIDEYKQFDPILPEILKNKDKRRDFKTMALGFLKGVGILIVLSIITTPIVVWLRTFLTENVMLIWFILILSSTLSLCSFVSGYTAGNIKFGVRNGILFFAFLNIILIISNAELFGYFLVISLSSLSRVSHRGISEV